MTVVRSEFLLEGGDPSRSYKLKWLEEHLFRSRMRMVVWILIGPPLKVESGRLSFQEEGVCTDILCLVIVRAKGNDRSSVRNQINWLIHK